MGAENHIDAEDLHLQFKMRARFQKTKTFMQRICTHNSKGEQNIGKKKFHSQQKIPNATPPNGVFRISDHYARSYMYVYLLAWPLLNRTLDS